MQDKFARMLVVAAKDNYMDLSLREQYSGRGMHDSTTAVVGDWRVLLVAAAIVSANLLGESITTGNRSEYEEFLDDIKNISSDLLGRRLIFY